MIKIEKNIPFESKTSRLPFEEMEVGDSFLIPKEILYTTVRIQAIQFAKRKKSTHKFSVKKVENGYRCWRIK